ncbi:MAG TPA: VWA domain-containing protein [Gaiella sp.]|jgi:Ca-activated chloride channel family protein|nr:VWA domain-containing protein [Gaiella sp.]
MSFSSPSSLLWLLAIPLLVGLYLYMGRRRRRAAARFANPALLPNLVPHSPGWRRHVPWALALVSLAVLVIGIARPHVVRDVTRNEATIVLAIDTSRSMAATDLEPSRFAAARTAAEEFLEEVPEEYAVGIVSFATSADPVLPPTTDREAARVALRELRLGSGTALGTAVTRAVDIALGRREEEAPPTQEGERSPAAVLVLSDGAQTSGQVRPLPAAQRARRLGVPVSGVAVGVGEAVVEVPLPGGLKQRVVVPPEPQSLQLIARTTGGTFLRAPGAGSLSSVYEELGTRLAKDRKRVEVTSAFAAGGAILLLLGGALSSHWFRRAL